MLDIFEKKNNTVAFGLIVIAAMLWGAFGLLSSQAQSNGISPLLFTLLATFFATVASYIYCLVKKINIKKAVTHSFKNKDFKRLFFYRMLVSFNILVTVAGFHFLSNKIIGVAISEINPLIAVMLSHYFFTDKDKTNKNNLFYTWLLIFLSLLGVLILLLHEISIGNFIEDVKSNQNNVWGILLTFLGAILIGFTTILGPKITSVLKADNPDNYTYFELSNIARLLISGVGFLLLLIISIIYFDFNELIALFEIKPLFTAAIFGIFVIYLPAILGMVGGAISTNHNVYLGWLIAPVAGTVVLWLFDYGEISPVIMLSLVLILVPNILLNLKIEDSFSFKVTFVWILLFTLLLFYYPGVQIDSDTYFDAANSLLVFFALMVGYLINKLNERNNFREQLFMRFLHKIRDDGVDEHNIEKISATFQQANNRLTDKVSAQLDGLEIKREKYSELLDFKFIQNRQLYNVGELFVLLLISLLLIGITTVYRENGFLYDSYSLIVNTAVVFTLAQVIEKMFFSEYQTRTPGRNIFMENVVGVLFLMILIVVIIILFLSKHNFNII